jgi:hypothetical protein
VFDKIADGWDLAKASGRVLRLDKELLVFPFLSGFACLLVLGSFGLPLFLSGAVTIDRPAEQVTQNPLAYVLLFAFYFCNYFVIVFFNSALIIVAAISAALHSILLAAIYVFAGDGRVPDAFDRSTLQAAFAPRR